MQAAAVRLHPGAVGAACCCVQSRLLHMCSRSMWRGSQVTPAGRAASGSCQEGFVCVQLCFAVFFPPPCLELFFTSDDARPPA